MRIAVRSRIVRGHADVRLRLGCGVERNRQLRVVLPVVPERTAERRDDAPNRRGVAGALRFANDQKAVDQLHALSVVESPSSTRRSYSSRVQRRSIAAGGTVSFIAAGSIPATRRLDNVWGMIHRT